MNFSVKNKIFSLLVIVMIVSVSVVGWYGLMSAKKSYIESTLNMEAQKIKALSTSIETFLRNVPNDLNYNAHFYALKKLLIWERLKDKRKIRYWDTIYISTLKDYIKNQKLYHQVRILDEHGKEKLVLKYNNKTQEVKKTMLKELQDKSTSNYFTQAINLQEGDFYISEMNLNVEFGKVEKPFVPVLRYAMPIVDKNREKQGVLVLNFNANKILEIIDNEKIEAQSSKKYYLINQEGDYLYAKDRSKRWAKQLNHENNFKNDYRGILDNFKNQDNVTFMDKDKIFSMHKVYPSKNIMENRHWYLIGVVDKNEAFSSLNEFVKIFFIILLSVLVIGLYLMNRYISILMNPLSKVSNQLISLSKGEIKRESIVYASTDEVGQIVHSTNILVDAIETTIAQANAIASGDFSKDVTLLSNRDALGSALIKMTKRLQEISNLARLLSKGNYERNLHIMGSDDEVGLALINMIDYLKEITKITESIAKGDLDVTYKPKGSGDRLGTATLEMITYLKSILKQANAISKKDFSSSIEVKSKDDELGLALVTMTDILRSSSIKNIEEIYFSEGLAAFNEEISGINDIMKLSKKAITLSCRYVGANSGVVYSFDKEKENLHMIAAYAYTERDELSNSFKLGEGVVGEVALEREAILLKSIKNATFEIQSATTLFKPKEVFTFPLIYEGELYGVAEIMSLESFSKLHKDYLLKIASVLATSLKTVSQNRQIKELLEKSQQAFQELQTQSEELQESNIQMEEQQQQLTEQSKELQLNNRTLAKAKAEIDIRAGELEKASKYKSEFLANVSHELRTPLNSIILLSKLISQNQNNTLTEDDIEKSLVIHRAGNDLLLLINDILDLSKVESGNMELVLESITSNEVLEELKGLFQSLANEKGIQFIIHDNFNSEFITDRIKLAQVMKNLLSNAFKFTKRGSVTIDMDAEKTQLLLKISDTGIGIAADKLGTIFDAFKQVDGSISREFGGTGLGLSISKTIVDLLDGTISVESTFGVGTSFIVSLPLKHAMTQAKESSPTQSNNLLIMDEEENHFDKNILKQKNILLVDDDSRNIFALTSILESMDAEVYSAFNGQDAIDTLEDGEKIDLILMDIMMPVMDGLDAIKKIKANDRFKHIPIIAITAKSMPEDKQICLDAGANDYLSKPLEPAALLSVLKAWVT